MDEFLNPPSVERTPPQSSASPLMSIEDLPGLREVPASEMENAQFKRIKIVKNERLKEFTNPSEKQFMVNNLCDVDPLCPYDKDQFKSFNKWLAGLVDNTKRMS